jgi:HSP20 family protein
MGHLFSTLREDRGQKDYPQFNVWEDSNGLLMTSELPGVEPEDLDIVATNDTLTVKGNKKNFALSDKDSYLKRELSYGSFSRSIKLPYRIDADRVEAKLRNGILNITLHRPDAEKPKNIQVTNN